MTQVKAARQGGNHDAIIVFLMADAAYIVCHVQSAFFPHCAVD